jgi:hypothetical protein
MATIVIETITLKVEHLFGNILFIRHQAYISSARLFREGDEAD